MSHETERAEEIPSLEPWLIVAILAFVPLTAAFILHVDYLPYMLSAGVAMTLTSLGMLVRQERRKRR